MVAWMIWTHLWQTSVAEAVALRSPRRSSKVQVVSAHTVVLYFVVFHAVEMARKHCLH